MIFHFKLYKEMQYKGAQLDIALEQISHHFICPAEEVCASSYISVTGSMQIIEVATKPVVDGGLMTIQVQINGWD